MTNSNSARNLPIPSVPAIRSSADRVVNQNLDETPRSTLFFGIVMGLLAASVGALYTVFARYGLLNGLKSPDMTSLRFGVAGIVTLPILIHFLRRDGAAIKKQWRIWLAVAVLAGPLFGLMMFTAFQFAPANHAAVFPFSAMSVMGTLLAARYLADPLTLRKMTGIAIVLVGLVVLSGLNASSLTARSLIGDAMFIGAGTLWAGFGIVLRRYRLNPLLATAVVSFFALLTYVPVYVAVTGGARLIAAAPSLFWIEVLIQGVIAGAGTLYTYAKTVQLLGAARAAVFPALAPGIAVLMGWPLLNHVPDVLETTGLTIAVVGLLISVTRSSRSSGAVKNF